MVNKSGVYKIVNLQNNKVYIGSCQGSIRKRVNQHKHYLRKSSHHSKKLQNAWNKYGEEAFDFSLVELCEARVCIELEQKWIYIYDAFNKGYNCNPRAANCEGRGRTLETKKKISNSLKGRKNPSTSRRVGRYHEDGLLIEVYNSQREAAKAVGVSQACISQSCRLGCKAKGYHFKLYDL
jgi:group I intron endonuclease